MGGEHRKQFVINLSEKESGCTIVFAPTFLYKIIKIEDLCDLLHWCTTEEGRLHKRHHGWLVPSTDLLDQIKSSPETCATQQNLANGLGDFFQVSVGVNRKVKETSWKSHQILDSPCGTVSSVSGWLFTEEVLLLEMIMFKLYYSGLGLAMSYQTTILMFNIQRYHWWLTLFQMFGLKSQKGKNSKTNTN